MSFVYPEYLHPGIVEKYKWIGYNYYSYIDLDIKEENLNLVDYQTLINSEADLGKNFQTLFNKPTWEEYWTAYAGSTLIAQKFHLFDGGSLYYAVVPYGITASDVALYSKYDSGLRKTIIYWDSTLKYKIYLKRYLVEGRYEYKIYPPSGTGTCPELPSTLTLKLNYPDAQFTNSEYTFWETSRKFDIIMQYRVFLKTNSNPVEKFRLIETGQIYEVVPTTRDEDIIFYRTTEIVTKHLIWVPTPPPAPEPGYWTFHFDTSGVIYGATIRKITYVRAEEVIPIEDLPQIRTKLIVSIKPNFNYKERQQYEK